jgi:hypothetical protein
MSAERVANALGGKQLMLLLDNCEHVIDAAARMAGALLHTNAAIRVLATSREPLRVEGEHLYRVPPLAVPAEGADDVDELLRHGAVQLFVTRARAADPHFLPDARTAAVAAAICRRLDGIPLAIELAAARGAALGIEDLALRLDDRFHLLTGGRRTALPRHQTLQATLDWSYELLSEPERVVLHRLAIFAGGFSLEAAGVVVASAEIVSSTVSRVSSPSRSSARMSVTRQTAIGCSKRHVPMPLRNWQKAVSSRWSADATPNTTGTSSSKRLQNGRHNPLPNGQRLINRGSTTFARRWTGRFRQEATARPVWP